MAGVSSLTEVEQGASRQAVGEVAGLEVIYLECHIDSDSISLTRAGAHVHGAWGSGMGSPNSQPPRVPWAPR